MPSVLWAKYLFVFLDFSIDYIAIKNLGVDINWGEN